MRGTLDAVRVARGVGLVVLAFLCACTIQAQIAGLKTLVAISSARAVAIQATMELDHERQEEYRKQYVMASSTQEITAVDLLVSTHIERRKQTYALLDQLEEVIETATQSIIKRRVYLAPVFEVLQKIPATLAAFGVKDERVLNVFRLLAGGG